MSPQNLCAEILGPVPKHVILFEDRVFKKQLNSEEITRTGLVNRTGVLFERD